MDKEKLPRKRSSEPRDTLPAPPPNPCSNPSSTRPSSTTSTSSSGQNLPDAYKRLFDYKNRESQFLKTLNETIIMDCRKLQSEGDNTMFGSASGVCSSSSGGSVGGISTHIPGCADFTKEMGDFSKISDPSEKSECELLRDECESFIFPLLKRTGPSISAALVSHDALDQLNHLYALLDQMLTYQEQNYQMRRYLRYVHTLCELKKLQKKDPNEIFNEAEASDNELDIEGQASLLNTILAAGNSASVKRNTAKRQRERSKSVITEDFQTLSEKEVKLIPLRRQSAFPDTKAKVSKWTKVKAAFKWERANVPVLNEGKSSDSGIGLTPINNEVARYLRVPSVPCTGSSADSVLSSSSGHLLSGGSVPVTPGTISSASSTEDIGVGSEETRNNRESSKSDSRCDSRLNEEETRRSRSLDGESVISPPLQIQSKNKTPWRKVKDIIRTHGGSFKNKSRSRSIKSSSSITCSRDASPCESLDAIGNLEDRTEVSSSNQTSPVQKNQPSLNLLSSAAGAQQSIALGSGAFALDTDEYNLLTSGSSASILVRDDSDGKLSKSGSKSSRKSKALSDFESLPEATIAGPKLNYPQHHHPYHQSTAKPPYSPAGVGVRQDFSDNDALDSSYYTQTMHLKGNSGGGNQTRSFKQKRSVLSGNSSVPSSPSRHSEFFGEFESEELSSGDFSEPSTPRRQLSPKCSLHLHHEEINEKYIELKDKLAQEFEHKRQEWEKIRAACCATTSCALHFLNKEEALPSGKTIPTSVLEENLPADFKKKLHKWRVMKQTSVTGYKEPQTSPTKEPDKKIDWNLWKKGQIKLEGQGLTPLPVQKDLPEEFQKKLEEWKRMKESNTVPTYSNQDSLRRSSGKLGISIKHDHHTNSKKDKEDGDKSDRDHKHRSEREKLKTHERDKAEKFSMLKALELPTKEIEVQTSVGVMKFEGISRKFTRKLYEWEKARGIGPESSTFALLHPGYRPLDVGNCIQEKEPHENSPTLGGRSLSLDSISPNPSAPSLSHQTSSLSLNDMEEIKDTSLSNDRRISSNPELDVQDNQEEPEAVIVEVEDDIMDTAAPLLTAIPIIEQQTPVYKYEQPCNELCAGNKDVFVKRNEQKKLDRLSSQTLDNVSQLKMYIQNNHDDYKKDVKHVQSILASLKESLPDLERTTRGGSPHVRDAFDIVKRLLKELMEMVETLDKSVNCSENVLIQTSRAIDQKLLSLQKSINLLCRYAELKKLKTEHLPEINVTAEDSTDKSVAIVCTTPTIFQPQIVINQSYCPKATAIAESGVLKPAPIEDSLRTDNGDTGAIKKVSRTVSNGSKKKTRLRKMGSRQNSKTESDSDNDATNIVLEAPRRLKRKASRNNKKTPEEERKVEEKRPDEKKDDAKVPEEKKVEKKIVEEEKVDNYAGEDIVYVLKIKPGQRIEQMELFREPSESNILISPMESSVQLMEASQENIQNSGTVFVKTKRKIYTAVEEQTGESRLAMVRDVESSSASDKNDKENTTVLGEEKTIVKNLPPIPQSPGNQRRYEQAKSNGSKEPSPSIRMMIAKYNQKLVSDQTRSPMSSGSCSPVTMRSPILDRRVKQQTEKYEEQVEKVSTQKSASAGNIQQNEQFVPVNVLRKQLESLENKIQKSSSVDTLPSEWRGDAARVVDDADQSHEYECSLPLARDSLKSINKNCGAIPKTNVSSQDVVRKEHLFRKNKEKPAASTSASRNGAIKRITAKASKFEGLFRRSVSSSATEIWTAPPPDKSDNTIPKITRKHEPKMPSPHERSRSVEAGFMPSTSSYNSAQPEEPNRPKTPLTERAMKLQRAKEEFLMGTTSYNYLSREEKVTCWKNRLSQVSAGSETSIEDCTLAKSASVGVIETVSSDNNHNDGYVSLPRSIVRSAKMSSKFGFASIAQKLRKVKIRRGSKDSQKEGAISALCRQSIAIDLDSEQANRQPPIEPPPRKNSTSEKRLVKSGSSQAILFGTFFRKTEKSEKSLSKSCSANTVPHHK